MSSPDELRQLVRTYAANVSSRDVDAVLGLFAADAIQSDPVGTTPYVGHESIRAFFQSAIDASAATLFEVSGIRVAGGQVAFDFQVTVTLETGKMIISGIEIFTVDDDNLITSVNAYWGDDDVTFA
jgi:steroid Delta-isomerase